jgi:hypothetical protein
VGPRPPRRVARVTTLPAPPRAASLTIVEDLKLLLQRAARVILLRVPPRAASPKVLTQRAARVVPPTAASLTIVEDLKVLLQRAARVITLPVPPRAASPITIVEDLKVLLQRVGRVVPPRAKRAAPRAKRAAPNPRALGLLTGFGRCLASLGWSCGSVSSSMSTSSGDYSVSKASKSEEV